MGAAALLGQGSGHTDAQWRAGHGNGGARALAVKWLTVGKLDTGGLKAEEGLEGI